VAEKNPKKSDARRRRLPGLERPAGDGGDLPQERQPLRSPAIPDGDDVHRHEVLLELPMDEFEHAGSGVLRLGVRYGRTAVREEDDCGEVRDGEGQFQGPRGVGPRTRHPIPAGDVCQGGQGVRLPGDGERFTRPRVGLTPVLGGEQRALVEQSTTTATEEKFPLRPTSSDGTTG
jgi:hypothetical protein